MAFLAFALLSACGNSTRDAAAGSTTTASTLPAKACPPLPEATGKTLAWIPADLPLPAGSYVLEDLSLPNLPYRSGDYVVPRDVEGFVRFVKSEWPERDWVLGKGEGEEGEAELAFHRGTLQGSFRIRAAFCDRSHTLLVLSLGDSAPPLGQGTTTTRIP